MYSIGLAVDRTGSTIAAQVYVEAHGGDGPAEVHVFHRDGAYSRVAILTPGAWNPPEYRSSFGYRVAISDDGGTIAVGHSSDTGYGTGPRAAPLNPGSYSGAVYVYRLKNTWQLANMVKPNYLPNSTYFGRRVALNGNGQTLLVGHGYEGSSAQGIGGNWANTGRTPVRGSLAVLTVCNDLLAFEFPAEISTNRVEISWPDDPRMIWRQPKLPGWPPCPDSSLSPFHS